ncbi:MAG: hypothetical protein CM15mP95_2330 [Alphaproteobacteria bacterium]|nr:MAG: hypothetical protein CM15mP95_2330 [Alphaproteobacteria bacterium]
MPGQWDLVSGKNSKPLFPSHAPIMATSQCLIFWGTRTAASSHLGGRSPSSPSTTATQSRLSPGNIACNRAAYGPHMINRPIWKRIFGIVDFFVLTGLERAFIRPKSTPKNAPKISSSENSRKRPRGTPHPLPRSFLLVFFQHTAVYFQVS